MRTLLKAGTILAAMTVFPAAAEAASFLPYTTNAQRQVSPASPNWSVSALVTIGETLPNNYRPVGIMDGIGAYRLDASTVRLLVNHELGNTAGASYALANGTNLTGARVSFFDVDISTRSLVNAGLAYDKIFDRAGNIVTAAAQINSGLNRLCSSSAFEANAYGAGRGLADRIYFTGEETGNGTMYALNTATNELHAVPMFGRAAFENATQINTGTNDKVAFILSDDSSGTAADPGSPMYLYVGTKGAKGDGSFLDRNGLAEGKLFVWKSDDAGQTNPSNFNSQGSTAAGSWVEIDQFDASKAGTPGYDALGYADAATLRAQATDVGAFRFSRPEDVATNPGDDTLIALASTGSGQFGGADTWGTVYTIDTDFDASGNPVAANVKVIYNGNDDPSRALRSPDNLDWKSDTELLIQEDRATDNWITDAGSIGKDAGILLVNLDGTVTTVARVDRTATNGITDQFPGASGLGEWETSGILDVSELFGLAPGTLFVGDVQAHGLRDAIRSGFNGSATLLDRGLVEGGQLFFLAAVPEPATWAMMIAGFGMVGGAMRRRARNQKAVSA